MRSRRSSLPVLCTAVLALAVALTGCSSTPASNPAPAAGNTPAKSEKPYAGTTLKFLATSGVWFETLKKQNLVQEFEDKTGIKLNMESLGEDQLTQRLTTEFTAGSSDVDVLMQRPLQEAKLFANNGWYVPLDAYIAKAGAEWDVKDFSAAAMATETVGDKVIGIPLVVEHEVLYYRKDLLAAAGIAVPKTVEELKAAAAKLTDKSKEQYGFVARGQRAPLVTQFSSFLYSNGGDFFDLKTGKATIDTPEFIGAAKTYGDLLRNFGPPGATNMSWPQAVAIFAQGKVALYTDADSIFANLLDPAKSQVAEKTGVAVFPAGAKGSNMYSVTSWGLAMHSGSKHKDAAWEFIKWASSKEVVAKIQATGAVPGARTSVWNSAEGKAKFPADWSAAAAASGNGRGYDRPLVVQVGNARDIVGSVVVAAIEGKDVDAAAKAGQKQFQDLLDAEKK